MTSSALLLGETFPANLERGAGIPAVDRLAYLAEMARAQLEGVQHLVLVDAKSPVSFFAYPGKASDLVPPGCTVHTLARPGEDAAGALEALGEALGAPADGGLPAPATRPDRPTGGVTAETLAAAVGATLPEGAIVVDEGNTSGLFVPAATAGAPRHDWLTLTGAPSVSGCLWPPELRWRPRSGRSSACRLTAAPCTRSRRCGRRRARA